MTRKHKNQRVLFDYEIELRLRLQDLSRGNKSQESIKNEVLHHLAKIPLFATIKEARKRAYLMEKASTYVWIKNNF